MVIGTPISSNAYPISQILKGPVQQYTFIDAEDIIEHVVSGLESGNGETLLFCHASSSFPRGQVMPSQGYSSGLSFRPALELGKFYFENTFSHTC